MGPVNSVMLLTNPLISLDAMLGGWRYRFGFPRGLDFFANLAPGPEPYESLFWAMMGIHIVTGLLFLSLAIAGLRPLRGSSWPGAEPRKGWWTRLRNRLDSLARQRTAAAVMRNELLASRIRRPPAASPR